MNQHKKLVIIGGVAGGASAAARARRLSEDAEIIMFEKGEYISFANCGLPYHISGDIKERNRLLLLTPEQIYKSRKIDARVNTVITHIDRKNKTVTAYNYVDKSEYAETYTDLILSPGAVPIRPEIPGNESSKVFTLRNIEDMDCINKAIESCENNTIAVVGGGFIGLEITEALVKRGIKVKLIELGGHVMSSVDSEMSAYIHQELGLQGVELYLGTSIESIKESADILKLTLSDASTFECGFVVMAAGVKPDTSLAKLAELNVGNYGGILVNEHMQTNDEHIYAVGDAIEVRDFVLNNNKLVPLAGPANRQGRIAADNIFGKLSTYRHTQGTSICKVFNMTIGTTGVNEKALKNTDIPFEKIYLHPFNHASYYAGASPISIKLIFNKDNGLVLGAQAVGQKGVDKRIDVFAVAIRAKLTVFDLENLELSYAPPYGSAKDPVNYAGFIASNILRGDTDICHANELYGDETLIDVRLDDEVTAGTIPGGVHIPLEELRDRLDEIPNDKKIIVFCKEGLRAYQACLMLNQLGYHAVNLSGGYKTYCMYHDVNIFPGEDIAYDLSISANDDEFSLTRKTKIVTEIDACGIPCPGPIMKLKKGIKMINNGEALRIISTDPGFVQDVPMWCKRTGHKLVELFPENGNYYATVIKSPAV